MNLRLGRLIPHGEWQSGAGLLLLLCLLTSAMAAVSQAAGEEVVVDMEPSSGAKGDAAALSANHQALRLRGGRADRPSTATLRFTLPNADVSGGRWIVWIGRNPVDAISLRGHGWESVQRDFFAPAEDAGLLPVGYQFPLPRGWSGPIELELETRGTLRSALQVKVLRESKVMRIEKFGAAMSAAIYTSLFTLALLTLALYGAARDRIFLTFFTAVLLTLLSLAADNGHLYQLPVFGLLAAWRGQGAWALGLLFYAATLQLLERYADSRRAAPRLARVVDAYCVLLCGLAAVCLLGTAQFDAWIPYLSTPAWLFTALLAMILIVDAVRRHIAFARPLALLVLLCAGIAFASEVWLRGRWIDPLWLRYAYQLVVASAAAVLAVALISRISEYRDQRDRDWLARVDTEQRMQREAARSNLNGALQVKLRACAEGDIEWTAFKLLLDHLVPLVHVRGAIVITRGYHGQDVQLVEPATYEAEAKASIERRELSLKRHAANGIPLQQPIIVSAEAGKVGMEALVPLQIRAPAWGLLLLERAGGEGFTTEELALAGEFVRVTLAHVDQALSAIQLRRSAELDALTGIFNRRTIDQWITRSFNDAMRDGQPISVLFVDLDHFKAINDRHGHACGDLCLRKVAAALRSALGEEDLLGRYGGEEFIAVLPGNGGAAARAAGEQLRLAVERLNVEWEGQTLQLTVSVGAATRLHDEAGPADTIERADKALYAAKRGGRNCVQVAPAVFR